MAKASLFQKVAAFSSSVGPCSEPGQLACFCMLFLALLLLCQLDSFDIGIFFLRFSSVLIVFAASWHKCLVEAVRAVHKLKKNDQTDHPLAVEPCTSWLILLSSDFKSKQNLATRVASNIIHSSPPFPSTEVWAKPNVHKQK